MPKNNEVSISVIRRLPRYYRFLGELTNSGVERISSKELSVLMGLTASQIRQDLNCFGGFGQQGYGYNIESLHQEIAKILGLDKIQKTVVIGAGNLGQAIITYTDFKGRGFDLIGVFDKKSELVGSKINNYTIQDISMISSFCRKNNPSVAILCIPRLSVAEVVDELIAQGVKGFWNFSNYDIAMNNNNIVVENVHLSDSLMTLSYKVNNFLNK